VADELEVLLAQEMLDVRLLTCEEVVEADHIVTQSHEAVAEVGTEKAGAAGDENALHHEGDNRIRNGVAAICAGKRRCVPAHTTPRTAPPVP
jgi:hypothetical protein